MKFPIADIRYLIFDLIEIWFFRAAASGEIALRRTLGGRYKQQRPWATPKWPFYFSVFIIANSQQPEK